MCPAASPAPPAVVKVSSPMGRRHLRPPWIRSPRGGGRANLAPGDEIVCGWPSFPSYVIDARKLGAVPRTVPLRGGRYDLDSMLEAVGPQTKLVYVCHP